jgi:hypothetical protein
MFWYPWLTNQKAQKVRAIMQAEREKTEYHNRPVEQFSAYASSLSLDSKVKHTLSEYGITKAEELISVIEDSAAARRLQQKKIKDEILKIEKKLMELRNKQNI